VVAENGDFMNADLTAGKTYYVLVKPRMGLWKARFSLIPIHRDPSAKYNTSSSEFSTWQGETSYVEVTPAAQQWYQQHKADIATKQSGYLAKWHHASEAQRAQLTLHAADGI
jgi:hypothetical protein